MKRRVRAWWYSLGLCAVVLAMPAWADVEVSLTYGTWGQVSNKNITVEGVGVGDDRVKGTEAFQRTAEAAALVGAVRNMGELITALQSDLRKLEKKERSNAILKLYADLPTLFPAKASTLSLPLRDLGSSILSSSMVRVGSAEVLGTTVVRGFVAIEDTTRLYIGEQELHVENLTTSKAEALPAVVALLNEQGFRWTFESNRDGSVTCRLTYPQSELEQRVPRPESSAAGMLKPVRGKACYTMGDGETPLQAGHVATSLARENAIFVHLMYVQSASAETDVQLEADWLQTAAAGLLQDVQSQLENKDREVCASITAKINPAQLEALMQQRVNVKAGAR